MAIHSFDPEIAAKVGVNAAVIYHNLVFWCEKNRANERHIHEGKAWTYNSMKAFGTLFPYLSADQIRRALEKLVEVGLVEKGNFNASQYDRTSWYCCPSHSANLPNGNGEKAEPIPDSKPDIKPDIYMDEFEIWWRDLVPERDGPNPKKVAKERYIKFRKKGVSKDAIWNATHEYRNMLAANGTEPRFIKQAATWLNTEPWIK